jgi:hypothetical protein
MELQFIITKNKKNMKRTTRKLSTVTKQRISLALKGRIKTEKHKEAISKSLVAYWKTIPDENGNSSVVE